ncbi:MAG: hypothetical protein AAF480_14165, partial [Actinomycetota bacterium]
MDQALIDRIREQMHYEFERKAPPEGFPAFHDIPTSRHISQEFHDLEQEHLWPRVWVMAGRAEDIPGPGDYFQHSVHDMNSTYATHGTLIAPTLGRHCHLVHVTNSTYATHG